MIKWTKYDKVTIDIENQIAKRAVEMSKKIGIPCNQMDTIMDIDACHCNGNPLRLGDLLVADDLNFAHDVFGIRRHINRKTGKLENCFLPRYTK